MENQEHIEVLFVAKKCIKLIGSIAAFLLFTLISTLIDMPQDRGSVLFMYALIFVWMYFRTKRDFLIIDKDHIKMRKGLIFVENQTIPVQKVASFQVDTLPWMLLFGYGKIYINLTSGESIEYPHVKNYQDFLTAMNCITKDRVQKVEIVNNNMQ